MSVSRAGLCLIAVPLFIVMATLSDAAPIEVACPGAIVEEGRQFFLTTDPVAATCYDYGTGPNEINGNNQDVILGDGTGWELIDKDQNPDSVYTNDSWFALTGIGASAGTFTISLDAWAEYGDLAIGFKVGNTSPIWAVFLLPSFETDGSWRTLPVSGGGGLSHAILYGLGEPDTPPDETPVPEPTSMLLLGSGLVGLAAAYRRRKN